MKPGTALGIGAAGDIVNAATGVGGFLYNVFNRRYLAQREDTAVQRRTADLKKAGINPLMAAGQAASSAAPATVRGTDLKPQALAMRNAALQGENQQWANKEQRESWYDRRRVMFNEGNKSEIEATLANNQLADYEQMRDLMRGYGLPAGMAGTRAAEVMMHQKALQSMTGPAKAGYLGLLGMIYGPGIASAIPGIK